MINSGKLGFTYSTCKHASLTNFMKIAEEGSNGVAAHLNNRDGAYRLFKATVVSLYYYDHLLSLILGMNAYVLHGNIADIKCC